MISYFDDVWKDSQSVCGWQIKTGHCYRRFLKLIFRNKRKNDQIVIIRRIAYELEKRILDINFLMLRVITKANETDCLWYPIRHPRVSFSVYHTIPCRVVIRKSFGCDIYFHFELEFFGTPPHGVFSHCRSIGFHSGALIFHDQHYPSAKKEEVSNTKVLFAIKCGLHLHFAIRNQQKYCSSKVQSFHIL